MKSYGRWAVTVLSVAVLHVSLPTNAASISGQGSWETTLQGRDLDGNLATAEAYYDTTLNITWLDNIRTWSGTAWVINAWTGSGWAPAMNWYQATSVVGSLDINGITGWRLPSIIDVNNDGCNWSNLGTDCGYNVDINTSEMAHLYHVTLGNVSYVSPSGVYPQAGFYTKNSGPFANPTWDSSWSATTYAPVTSDAWIFNLGTGAQDYRHKQPYNLMLFAVHAGDIGVALSSVPAPAAAWLFGSGLLGLIGFARRKKPAV